MSTRLWSQFSWWPYDIITCFGRRNPTKLLVSLSDFESFSPITFGKATLNYFIPIQASCRLASSVGGSLHIAHSYRSCDSRVVLSAMLDHHVSTVAQKGQTKHLLCLNSESASFRGAFEDQLRHNAMRRLPRSEGSSRCSSFSLFLEDASLRSFVERKRENGDSAWRRSSLLRAWVAEIVT